MNKIQWKRSQNNELELYVFEPNTQGLGSWKLYTSSKCFVADSNIPGFSRGLETMRNCLKNGYILLDINGVEVEKC